MSAQCTHRSPKNRACLFDASPEHDVHMNIGETWYTPGKSSGLAGALSSLEERIAADRRESGKPSDKRR